MSWLVDVEFRPSLVEGTGIFAKDRIKAGTKLWTFDESMKVCDARALRRLDAKTLSFALHGGYLHGPSDRFLWYTDGMQYMNHAPGRFANVGLGHWPALRDDHCVALRDIAEGEEMFEDYTFWANAGLEPGHWLHPFYMSHGLRHFQFLSGLVAAPEVRPAAA